MEGVALNSRVSLSILAGLSGSVLMYLLVSVKLVPIAAGEHNVISVTIIMVGLVFITTGWFRIFRRRPSSGSG